MTFWRIIEGDCRDALRTLDAGSIQTCVTSPPYFGLRDYGHDAQIGLDPTPEDYVDVLVGVFREVRRTLADDGTLWLNLGDSYNAYNGGAGPGSKLSKTQTEQRPKLATGYGLQVKSLKPKDLLGIPWMVAFALRTDGWWLRQEIIWHKRSPMPESVRDRCTRAHEHLFMLTKNARYFYDADAIAEDAVSDHPSGNGYARDERTTYRNADGTGRGQEAGWTDLGGKRNRRDVWTLSSEPYSHKPVFREDGSNGWVVVHHSLDGRELHEDDHDAD